MCREYDDFEYVDEEPVRDNEYEVVRDEDLYERLGNDVEVVGDTNVEVVPSREYERYRVYAVLADYTRDREKPRGYVTFYRNSWFLSAAPGIPFTRVVFKCRPPEPNTYIKVKNSRKAVRGKIRSTKTDYVIEVLDWEYAEPPALSPPIRYGEYRDMLLDGIEFVNSTHEDLFALGIVGSPYIFAGKVMMLGGIRSVVYKDYSGVISDIVGRLMMHLPKPIYQVSSSLYRNVKTRSLEKLEKIANKAYKSVTLPGVPVESIGILEKAGRRDEYELRILREYVFSIRILTPYIRIGERINQYAETTHSILQHLVEKDPFTGSILAYLGINDTIDAVIRLASANARKELRREVSFNDIEYAVNKLKAIFGDLSSLIGNIASLITPTKLGNLIVELINKHGNTTYIGGGVIARCIDSRSLKEELIKYGIDPELLNKTISYLRFTKNEVLIHRKQICLIGSPSTY